MRQRPLMDLIRHSNQSQASVLHVSDPMSESSSGLSFITRLDREVGLHLVLSKIERTVPGDFDCSSTKDHIQ